MNVASICVAVVEGVPSATSLAECDENHEAKTI